MQAYLAEKYMSGPKADAILARTGPRKKKRKTAHADTAGGSSSTANPTATAPTGAHLAIRDDDGGWGDEGREDDDDAGDAVVDTDRSFKKRRAAAGEGAEGGGWATVREGMGSPTPEAAPGEDEAPLVVGGVGGEDQPAAGTMRGGLLTSTQLRKTLSKKAKDTGPATTEEEIAAAQETVYRDASGRRIDTKAERAEAARVKREREAREAAKMEWGKGLVQREEEERRKAQLEAESRRDLAVYADDRALNEEQKARDRWNDPAAAFLSKKQTKGPRKPQYSGPPPPPNRYGIKPGYRWDGVDRGNGFEKKLFQKTNERKRTGLESYQWSVDDM